jgi:hypothetical protein
MGERKKGKGRELRDIVKTKYRKVFKMFCCRPEQRNSIVSRVEDYFLNEIETVSVLM